LKDNNSNPRDSRGFTIFFTGLSGSGKSTLSIEIKKQLETVYDRTVTLLDGDVVRQLLSSELNFSEKHRHLNAHRNAFVASEINKHGGITICALIAPYEQSRREARALVSRYGRFVEVYLSTSLETCEKRDAKGLYELARLGKIKAFTGISDPYETPESPEIILDTEILSQKECAGIIMKFLKENNLTQK
jgi:sulfate adenylyltransferase